MCVRCIQALNLVKFIFSYSQLNTPPLIAFAYLYAYTIEVFNDTHCNSSLGQELAIRNGDVCACQHVMCSLHAIALAVKFAAMYLYTKFWHRSPAHGDRGTIQQLTCFCQLGMIMMCMLCGDLTVLTPPARTLALRHCYAP